MSVTKIFSHSFFSVGVDAILSFIEFTFVYVSENGLKGDIQKIDKRLDKMDGKIDVLQGQEKKLCSVIVLDPTKPSSELKDFNKLLGRGRG